MKSMVNTGDVDLIVLSFRSLKSMAKTTDLALALWNLEAEYLESRWSVARGSDFRRFRLHDITRKS